MDESTDPKPRRGRRWLRLSVGLSLVVIAVIAAAMGRLTNQWRAERRAIETIRRLGGVAYYDYQYANGVPSGMPNLNATPPGPEWLRRQIGDEPFGEIVALDLSGGKWHDDDLVMLEALPRVRRLNLMFMPGITDDGLRHLDKLTTLRHLNVYRNRKITDAGVAHLRNLTELEALFLDSSSVTDAGLDSLLAMKQLRELDLDLTPVGDAGLAKLKALPKLAKVFVQNSKATQAGADDLKRALPAVMVELGSRPGSYGRP